jgi:ATP-dependent Clp protease, protease subunit
MPKILSLAGAKSGSPLKIRNKTETEAEIIIYDQIGADWFGNGITAKSFVDEMKKLDPKVTTLNVRINSPGGDVFDGITIFNRLKQFKGTKKVYIDGLAASIASIIALAGDEVIIGEGAMFMVHLPWTWAVGNRTDLDNTVNRLMDIEEQMLGIYAKRSNLEKSEIRAMLEKETWMGADEAIEHGFADSKVEETMPIAASAMTSRWINKAPRDYFSEAKATQEKIDNLKQKVSARLARK